MWTDSSRAVSVSEPLCLHLCGLVERGPVGAFVGGRRGDDAPGAGGRGRAQGPPHVAGYEGTARSETYFDGGLYRFPSHSGVLVTATICIMIAVGSCGRVNSCVACHVCV
jgi:hypothetical protein